MAFVHNLTLLFQQVCKNLQKGNWTLEREEDKTGPYAFNNKTWIAFDDDSSLKIKVRKPSENINDHFS